MQAEDNGKARTVSEAVDSRIAMRAFHDTPVAGELVRRLLTAAARSPSGGNLQPWHVFVLGGDELARFKALMRERLRANPRGDGPGYDIYPPDLGEPYRTRRAKCGEDMYAPMGIPREDKAARIAFIAGNFQFWNAPVAMFFCLDKQMGPPQWSDLGMYIQTLMLLAREAGLHSCPQEAWTLWHKTVGEFLGLPENMMLFCGLALGYADHQHPVSRVRTERAPLHEFATLKGI
jgi:nitroreductase